MDMESTENNGEQNAVEEIVGGDQQQAGDSGIQGEESGINSGT